MDILEYFCPTTSSEPPKIIKTYSMDLIDYNTKMSIRKSFIDATDDELNHMLTLYEYDKDSYVFKDRDNGGNLTYDDYVHLNATSFFYFGTIAEKDSCELLRRFNGLSFYHGDVYNQNSNYEGFGKFNYPFYYGRKLKNVQPFNYENVKDKLISTNNLKSFAELPEFKNIEGIDRLYYIDIDQPFLPLDSSSNFDYFDAFVNAGNPYGLSGGGSGITGALRASCDLLKQELACQEMLKVHGLSQMEYFAGITPFYHNSKKSDNCFKYVIETCGPDFRDCESSVGFKRLQFNYHQILECVQAHKLNSIYIPNISSGIYRGSIPEIDIYKSWFP